MADESQSVVVSEPKEGQVVVAGKNGTMTREEEETIQEAEEHKEIKKKSGNTESLTKTDSFAKEETKQAVEKSVTKDPSGRIVKKMSMEQTFTQEWSTESSTETTTKGPVTITKGPVQVLQIKE